MPNKKYIGDGVYALLDPARMIVLRTDRGPSDGDPGGVHWIALEPEVLAELIAYAYEIGWGSVIENARIRDLKRMHDEQRTRAIGDDEYARDEEDAQRIRDAAEGFDE